MVVGRMPNGQQLVVGAGDGGVEPGPANESAYNAGGGYGGDFKRTNTNQSAMSVSSVGSGYGTPVGRTQSRVDAVPPPGYGNQNSLPPAYAGGGVGENLHGQRAEKR